jgi:hypothetical protein
MCRVHGVAGVGQRSISMRVDSRPPIVTGWEWNGCSDFSGTSSPFPGTFSNPRFMWLREAVDQTVSVTASQ